MERGMVSFRFPHGLGDCANFAHVLPLFQRRGFGIAVQCTADKAPLFRAAGAALCDQHQAARVHHYFHPAVYPITQLGEPWAGNKVAHNTATAPMPIIGTPKELWDELCNVRLSLGNQITPEHRQRVDQHIASLPRPLICLHTKGNTCPENKNIPDPVARQLYDLLLEVGGSLVLLDWDRRVPRCHHQRARHLLDDFGHFGLLELAALYDRADLLIGIDSGPLHFARFSDVPVLGIWPRHYPSHFVLPRERSLHLVDGLHRRGGDRFRRHDFGTVAALAEPLSAGEIALHARRLLAPPRWLPAAPMRDAQLQHFVDLTDGHKSPRGEKMDRNVTFGLVLDHLAKMERPQIVETGCIRGEEDWSGAGFSTQLFGHFVHYSAGRLDSVDLTEQYVRFARLWTRPFADAVTVHHRHSHDWLRERSQPIDLFYSDSADTDTPGYQECCLEEVRLAQPHLHDRSMILIDDSPWAGGWTGKGALAIPWLLTCGWTVARSGYQCLLRRE